MDWLKSIIYGLLAGLTNILPVSAQAHRILLMNLFGETAEPVLLRLLIDLGVFGGLYYGCQSHITRIIRAQKLAKIPKRRRKRPLDTRSLMDLEVLKTMLIPIIIGFLFFNSASSLGGSLVMVSWFMFLNGLILYVPRYLPGSNKDSQTLTRVESFLMGLGAGASVLPGISCVGAVSSVGAACGVDKQYALDTALLVSIPVMAGRIIFDIIAIITTGLSGTSFLDVLRYILSAVAAFGGVYLGMRAVRALIKEQGFGIFAYYCWGAALFTFILFLNI